MVSSTFQKIGKACSSALGRRFFLAALIVLVVDRVSKVLVEKFMFLSQTIPLWKGVFHLTSIQNRGAGFGLLRGRQTLLILISLLAVLLILYYLPSIIRDRRSVLPFALLFGGALGNLLDRVFLGYVVDFLDFRIWPVFNIADSAITIGAILLVVYYWKEE